MRSDLDHEGVVPSDHVGDGRAGWVEDSGPIGRPGQPQGAAASVGALDGERELLNRYVAAFEHADIDGLVALLREDATLRMPPQPSLGGGLRIARFFLETVAHGDLTRIRHTPTWANG